MNKQEWISHKIGILIREGRPQDQAAAIAYSMWERGDHKQEGGSLPLAQFGGIQYANGQDLYGNMVQNAQNMGQPTNNPYSGIPSTNMPPFDQAGYNTSRGYDPNMGYTGYVQGDMNLSGKVDAKDATDKYGQPSQGYQNQNQDWIKYNILNPYSGGMDMNTRLAYTGQQFGQGHTGRGIMGAGLSLLGGARSVLSGYAAGKGQYDLEKQYHDKQYNNDEGSYRRTENYQQGGQLPEEQFNIQAQTHSPDWLTSGATQPIVPGQQAQDPTIVPVPTPAQAATPTNVDEGKGYDKNSARDTWESKTGLPWSEAKRLGYTNGTAGDNTKLLGELNDPRFRKEALRTKPFTPNTQATGSTKGQGTVLPQAVIPNNAAQRQWNQSLKSNSIDDSTYNPLERLVRMEGNNMKTPTPNKSYKSDEDQLKMAKMIYDLQRGGAGAFNPNYFQQGGLTQADLLTGNYMTGEGQQNPNVEVEDGEYTKNAETNQVQEVVGDKHVDGGEKVELPNKSKVLSDYTKIGATNVKSFNEMFDIKAKASDTFASVLDKYNSKIGVKKLEEEEKELLEKLEKNTKTSMDKSTKQINEDFLAQEIAEVNKKKESLNKLKAQAFESIFNEQEKVPKKGDGTQILNEQGNPIMEKGKEAYQEGGQAQQGGVDPNQVAQALQQGADPNEVVQQLVQSGISQEEAVGMVQQIIQQLQGAQGQGQPQMREGGMYEDLTYHQTKPVVEEKPYTFSTQYTPTVVGYDVTGSSVLNQPTLSDVEYMQHYTGKGYGQKMADIEKTIGTHGWYFDTEAKKKAFREAALKPNSGGAVKDFQSAYNQELTKRAKEAGLNQDQIGKAIGDIGFTGTGVQQLDDKFGAFTSTRPIFSFNKTEVAPTVTEQTPTAGTVPRDVVKNIVPTQGMPYVMPPSAPIAPYLQQVDLSRLEGQKGSVENQLQASENARQAAYAATKGLPPAQAAAMMANYLSTSGQQDTQGIAAQEVQDLQNKARIEQYNAGQLDKEKLLNEQLKKQYEREAFGTLNVNEQNWRNYYDANEANRQAASDAIERRNIMNLGLTNYQLNGQGGFDFVNKSQFQQVQSDPKLQAMINALPLEQRMAYEKALTAKNQAATGNVVDLSKYKK